MHVCLGIEFVPVPPVIGVELITKMSNVNNPHAHFFFSTGQNVTIDLHKKASIFLI